VVFEVHDSVAHEDALQVDVLGFVVAVLVQDAVGDVGHVLACVALARDLSKGSLTNNLRSANSGALVKMKSLRAATASSAVSWSVQW